MFIVESLRELFDFSTFSFDEIGRSFFPLFFTIDILGCIPIILSLKARKQKFNPKQVAIYSGLVLLIFLALGASLLKLLSIDIYSFGVAGGIILFVMAVEMVFGLEIFKEDSPSANATFVPLVFPLFAGAAAFTLLLTLKSQGLAPFNIAISIGLNMIFVYLGLIFVDPIERFLGESGAYILRKFFGVVLLALSVKFIADGLIQVIATIKTGVAQAIS